LVESDDGLQVVPAVVVDPDGDATIAQCSPVADASISVRKTIASIVVTNDAVSSAPPIAASVLLLLVLLLLLVYRK
jgi:hypothetical protein